MTKAKTDHTTDEHAADGHAAKEHAAAGHAAANPKTAPEDDAHPSNAIKDPHEWTTGGESMTGAQASYLKTLCEEAKEEFNPDLTKAEASMKIDELRNSTGRGKDH